MLSPKEKRRSKSKERCQSIYTRVTPIEKQKIERTAKKCGLSVSEYVRQRCLGYAPREVPPDTYYKLCGALNEASRQRNGDAILSLLDDMRKELILPGRDG